MMKRRDVGDGTRGEIARSYNVSRTLLRNTSGRGSHRRHGKHS
jgi:hypothetical protein